MCSPPCRWQRTCSKSAPVEGQSDEESSNGPKYSGIPAADWPANELENIARTDDLHISPFCEDGKTYGTPTWIWSVVVDGNLYVRG